MAALAAITGYNMSLSKNEGCRLHGDLGVHPFLGVGDIIYTHVARAKVPEDGLLATGSLAFLGFQRCKIHVFL